MAGRPEIGQGGAAFRWSEKLLAAMERFVPLRRFGWAFLLAWVFCVFYTGAVDGYTGSFERSSSDTARVLFFAALPVAMSVLMLILIVGFEKRLGSPTQHPLLFWVAPLATALSTPFLFWTVPNLAATEVLFAVGSVLTGFGSGFMWVMWGEYYARISQEDAEFLAPVSAVLAAVLVLLVSSMHGWVALAAVTLFPVLSGLCLLLSWRDVRACGAAAEYKSVADRRAFEQAHDTARAGLSRVLAAMGRAGFGILAACLFVCLEGSFWDAPAKDALSMQAVFVVSIVFMLAVGLSATAGPRRVSLSFLYRWMCPALVVGFAAIIVLGSDGGTYLAYVVAIAARFVFCLITQMYFARYAVRGAATPVQSYGLGWIFVHLGDLLGVVALVFVDTGIGAGWFNLAQVAAVSMALLVASTMFVLNDGRSFTFEVPSAVQDERAALDLTLASDGLQEGSSGGDLSGDGVAKGALAAGDGADAVRAHDLDVSLEVDELTARIRLLARESGLTPRETEVFDLLARGRSIPYVRDALIISKETAATHAKHVYAKLDIHSRQELIDLVM